MDILDGFIYRIDNNSLDICIDYKILNKEKVCQRHYQFEHTEAFLNYIFRREMNVYKHYNQDDLMIKSIYHDEESKLIIEIIEQQDDINNSILANG